MNATLRNAALLLAVGALLAGCAAGRAFKRADQAARVGDWDTAVRYYTEAAQANPNSAEYKIALERARLAASRGHLSRAAQLEAAGEIEGAIVEYRLASEFDPANRRAAAKVTALEQVLRDRAEAARPKPAIEQMKERVRQAAAESPLNPTSRDPLYVKFAAGVTVRQVLEFLGQISGINILFEATFNEQATSKSAIDLSGVTLEEALTLVMTSNTLFYKVMNPKTILVMPDNPAMRQRYEDQVIKTIPLSHADPAKILGLLNAILVTGTTQAQFRPVMQVNEAANSITIRGSASMVAIAERVIENNDRPRAEVVIDVEILEVNRTRMKQYGLSLSNYQIGLGFYPEVPPAGAAGGGATPGTTTGGTAANPLNLNSIVHGVNTADFYVALPQAVIKFLESDSKTKLIAKPSLRGSEGTTLTANLGDDIPVPSTSFMPLVGGGTAINPMTSFTYRPVGVIVSVTPRVTYDGDIILDLEVESSTKGADVNIAGQNLPAFGSRKVKTRMRLRDGESNLLAGLLRDEERKMLTGFPGGIHVPIIKQLFSGNDEQVSQTDIVMLLTPRIIRTQALTERNLEGINIGTAQNPVLGGGLPPLIGQVEEVPPAPNRLVGADATPPAPPITTQPYGTQGAALVGGAPVGKPTAAGTPVVPPGASPIPGTVMMPPGQAAAAAGQPPAQPAQAQAAVPPATPPAAAAPPAAQAPPPVAPPSGTPPAAVQAPPASPYGLPAAPAAGAPSQMTVTVPGADWRVGQGPYTVTLSALNMVRVSTVTLTLTYNPAALKLRSLQEGSFMRSGVPSTAFAQQADAAAGRIDITISRSGDIVGATGGGPLAALVFDAVAPGTVNFRLSGTATGPGGSIPLQFIPATVTVK